MQNLQLVYYSDHSRILCLAAFQRQPANEARSGVADPSVLHRCHGGYGGCGAAALIVLSAKKIDSVPVMEFEMSLLRGSAIKMNV